MLVRYQHALLLHLCYMLTVDVALRPQELNDTHLDGALCIITRFQSVFCTIIRIML